MLRDNKTQTDVPLQFRVSFRYTPTNIDRGIYRRTRITQVINDPIFKGEDQFIDKKDFTDLLDKNSSFLIA